MIYGYFASWQTKRPGNAENHGHFANSARDVLYELRIISQEIEDSHIISYFSKKLIKFAPIMHIAKQYGFCMGRGRIRIVEKLSITL